MAIRDKNIDWKRKQEFYSAESLAAFVAENGVGTGAPVIAEVSTLGITGVDMAAAGDEVDTRLILPFDLDVREEVGFRLVWTSHSTTAADTIDWIILYNSIAELSTIAAGDTALDTVIPQDVVGTTNDYALEITGRGIISADKLTHGQLLTMKVEMHATDIEIAAAAEPVHFLGVLLDYIPRKTRDSEYYQVDNDL